MERWTVNGPLVDGLEVCRGFDAACCCSICLMKSWLYQRELDAHYERIETELSWQRDLADRQRQFHNPEIPKGRVRND